MSVFVVIEVTDNSEGKGGPAFQQPVYGSSNREWAYAHVCRLHSRKSQVLGDRVYYVLQEWDGDTLAGHLMIKNALWLSTGTLHDWINEGHD